MKRQGDKKKSCIRPSPNEETAIVQSEQERRKKIRLKQVREQEKAFALKVRQNIKNKRENELKILSDELQKQWTEKHLNEQKSLENKYQKNIEKLGDGHAAAVVDQNASKKDNRILTKEEKQRAMDRHNQAMNQLLLEKEKCQKAERNHIEIRTKAIEVEKARSALIASLPPTKDILLEFELTQEKKLQPKNIEDFKSTHYHLQMPAVQVEKMDKENQVDARFAAEEEEVKIHGIIEVAQRSQSEQAEKARLRHKHALAQLKIEEDHKKLMDELGDLERMDRQRRQNAVARIPVRIFQPPHKRVEDAEERQRDLEQAFEDMYMMQTGYTGDLTIALEPSTDPVLIPEEHQLLVPEERTPGRSEATVPIVVPPQQADRERIDDVGIGDLDNVPRRENEEAAMESASQDDEQKETIPKGEDAVKRLLLRIQQQREQVGKEKPTASVEKVDQSKKTPAPPSRMTGKHISARVNVLTPLPEEEEQLQDEYIPRTFPPHPHPKASGPTTQDLPTDTGDTQEMRTLLHPYEAARQARTVITREEEDEPVPRSSQETMPSPLGQEQKLLEQLEEQRSIQQRLEEQLKEYHNRFQALSSERSQGPYDGSAQKKPKDEAEVDGEKHLKESEPHGVDDESGSLEERDEGSLPSIESGVLSLEEQTVDEAETSGTSSSASDRWPKSSRPPETLPTVSNLNEDPYRKAPSAKPQSSRPVYGSDSDEDYSNMVIPQKHDLGREPGDQPPKHNQYPLALRQHETTGESFPMESSESEGRLESEELSSSSGSLDSKHQAIPTSGVTQDRFLDDWSETIDRPFRQIQGVVHSFPSSTRGSIITDSTRNKISSETSLSVTGGSISTKISDQRNGSSYSSSLQPVPDFTSYFQGPRLRTPGIVNATPSPTASQTTPSVTQSFDGSPNYVDEYRRKWEEEKMLIENQRQLIKQKQEQQHRRMRYYKDILERYEQGSPVSLDVGHSITSEESPIFGVTSRAVGSSNITSVQSQVSDKFRSDHKSTEESSREIATINKENENVHANKGSHVPPLVGLKGSSSSSDNSYRRSFPWTSDSSSSGRTGNRFSVITKDPQVSRKSTSTSDFSLPSSGTEYHSLKLSPDPSAFGTNLDLANGSRSSITTLSELNEMMTKFTSSSENELERDIHVHRRLARPIGRTSWSEYLTENTTSVSVDKDSAGPSTVGSMPYSTLQSASVNHPTRSETETQAGSDIETQRWHLPPKASTQSTSSTGRISEDSSFDTSNLLLQDPKADAFGPRSIMEDQWILPPKASTQSIGAVGGFIDESSLETSTFQPGGGDVFDKIIYGEETSRSLELHSSPDFSNLQNLNTSISSQIQQWFVPPKASTQSMGSLGPDIEGSNSNTRGASNIQSTSSPFQQWVVPAKASTQSMGSLGPISEDSSPNTRDTSNIQSLSTSTSSPLQQWVVPAKASTQSMGSLGPISEDSSPNTRDTSNIQSLSTSTSSLFQQWVVPAKASTQSMGSLGPISEDSSPNTSESRNAENLLKPASQSSVKWYLPTKASTRSMIFQESIQGESIPDQSVFVREPVSGDGRNQRMPTTSLSSVAAFEKRVGKSGATERWVASDLTQSPLDGYDSSSSNSENIETRLKNMGSDLLQLDKLLEDSPSPSLSSGSLETDNNATSHSEHSTTESYHEHEKSNEPGGSPKISDHGEETEEAVTLKGNAIGSGSHSAHPEGSDLEEPFNVPSPNSDSNSISVSLQDAFAQRKKDFVKKSLARVTRSKEKRFEVKPGVRVKKRMKHGQTKKTSFSKKQPPWQK